MVTLKVSNEQIIKTACPHDCPDTCSMLATVQDGKLLRVAGNPENPFTRGNLCRKVAHYEERTYLPTRCASSSSRYMELSNHIFPA